MADEQTKETTKLFTKADLQEVLDTLEKKTVDTKNSHMHSILLLNNIFRQPNAAELFDENLKKQARELWAKMKGMGIQLADPPLLFGMPAKDGSKDGAGQF